MQEEQQKSADFLSTYDKAVRCAKQELDKWKELKKGLLEQMFVRQKYSIGDLIHLG